MTLNINLDRVDRTYKPGDTITGNLNIHTSSSFAHAGITIEMAGVVGLQYSAKSVGLFEAFYNSLKPVVMVDYKLPIEASGNVKEGVTDIPFEFLLKPLEGQELHESYHGVYVNISYMLNANIVKRYFGKDLTKSMEFIVELEKKGDSPKPVREDFDISQNSIEVKKKGLDLPDFRIFGHMDSLTLPINLPITGTLVLEHCSEPIKGIELQLVRLETCGCADGYAKEATEIQNIQIVDGDLPRGVEVPIYMVFPRLFTCPSLLASRTYKIEFQLSIVMMMPDGRLLSKKFPLTLVR
jgi:hypothetical protein